jgi:hypothetical protein
MMDKIGEEHRLHRAELAAHSEHLAALRVDQKRRFDSIDAAMENDKRVTREMVLQLQALRKGDKERHEESRAMVDGLMRVLDRLDSNDGPSPAGA